MPILREIAHAAGVSISTASRALSGAPNIRRETRSRIKQIADDMGYSPNRQAQALRRSPTRAVGILLADARSSTFSAMSAIMLQHQLQQLGYGVVLYVSGYDKAIERDCLDQLRAQNIDGLIHVPCTSTSFQPIFVNGCRIPLVEFLRRTDGDDADSVIYDAKTGAEKVVSHLLELGHRRIGMILSPAARQTAQTRLTGAYQAIDKARLPRDTLQVFHGETTVQTGRRALRYFMKEVPDTTALFAAHAPLLFGVELEAKQHGIRFPEHFSIASFGDPEWGMLLDSPPTSYVLPLHELALTAAQLIASRIEQTTSEENNLPTKIVVSGSLVVRESTAPPRSEEIVLPSWN